MRLCLLYEGDIGVHDRTPDELETLAVCNYEGCISEQVASRHMAATPPADRYGLRRWCPGAAQLAVTQITG